MKYLPQFIASRFTLLLSLLLTATLLLAQKQVPEPSQYLVNDYAGLLNRSQVEALGAKLRAYVGETSTQIVIVTEKSLEGDDAFEYTQRLGTAWGIGGRENDNGVLIFVSKDDREVRIQTGQGTEGFLPDVTAKRIIENIIVPAFRSGDYYQGLDRATSAIVDLGRGEYEGDGFSSNTEEVPGWIIIVFIILLVLIMSWMTHNDDDDDDGGYYRGGRYDMPNRRYRRRGGPVIFPGGGGFPSSGGGGGGGGFGGFGGGGFGGFGGGSFGGGGAGGSW